MRSFRVGLIGDYNLEALAHEAIPMALRLSAEHLGCEVKPVWLPTRCLDDVSDADLKAYAGLWSVPASPYENMHGALRAIRLAREEGRPFLGTCAGYQHALIEYARDVLGLVDADHEETNPEAGTLLVSRLPCPMIEVPGRIRFVPGTRLAEIYGVDEAIEMYHCSFGLNPEFRKLIEASEIRISAVDDNDEVKAIELPNHPFFLATAFQPERAALKGERNPLVTAFVSSFR